MKLEVIATTLDDVKAIAKSNADRIEFCKDMSKGGLTPERKYVIHCLLHCKDTKPIKVMIRPTDKTYNYSFFNYLKMWFQVHRFCRVKEVEGLVFGILNKKNEVDINRMGRLIRICKKHGKTVTFHRAFDETPNPEISLNILKELGVDTVLTTGGLTPINENLKVLKRLKNLNDIDILAGGGVDFDNCLAVAKVANEVHVGSAIRYDHDWNQPIDVEEINKIKAKINEETTY